MYETIFKEKGFPNWKALNHIHINKKTLASIIGRIDSIS